MNELQIFNNPEFGDIRVVEFDGEPWFVGKDVAAPLGYANPSKAVVAHVDDEDKRFEMLPATDSQNGNLVKTALINESGVYSLIFSSRLKKAHEFKRWVTSVVLPSIRKHGAYIAPQAQAQGLETFAAALETLTAAVQALTQRMDQQDQARRKALPPPRTLDEDNPFDDCPVPIKPPSNKMRRQWMRTASDKLNALADKCGIPSSSVLHALYRELEEDEGVILSEVRLKALEEHQLTDCSVLMAIFYDANLRRWFEDRVDQYLIQDTPAW